MQILDYIVSQRQDYENRSIELPGGGEYSQNEMIARNNKNWRNEYYTDQKDNIIGNYPYDGIAKPIVLLEARATDFAVRHIEVEPKHQTRKSRVSAMVITRAIHRWARKHHLAKLLDDITLTRPKYGGVLVKRNKDSIDVVPWENVITDQSDIMQGSIIERHYYTPAELKKMTGWDNIAEAIRTADEGKEADHTTERRENITQGNYIEVYEVHGELPVSMIKEAKGEEFDEYEEQYEYTPAMIVCTLSTKQMEDGSIEHDGLILYADYEKELPYMYLARNPQVGRGLGESVYESLREHQKWHNYSKTEEVRMMAIAGKMLYITNQPDAMTNIFNGKVDHGTVLRLGADANGQPNFFQQVNQVPQGTPVYQNMREEWAASARMTTSAHAAKLGEEAKSGTPFRAQYLQNIEASSQFEKYRNEIGEQLIQPMVEKWIIEDAVKELKKEDELYDTFSDQELEMIDEVLVEKAKTRAIVDASLAGRLISQEEVDEVGMQTQQKLRKYGNKRTIKGIKSVLGDIDCNVVVHVTDEMRSKAVLFESYANLLNVLAPEDPRRNAIIDRIMDSMGVTTDELKMYEDKAAVAQQQMPGQGARPSGQVNLEQLMREQQPAAQAAA